MNGEGFLKQCKEFHNDYIPAGFTINYLHIRFNIDWYDFGKDYHELKFGKKRDYWEAIN